MSKLYAYSATAAGIARLAQQRGQQTAAIAPPKPERALLASPVSNVVRFRLPAVSRRLPAAKDFSRAKHLAFLASVHVATSTPITALIGRVAAWHGFTVEQMLESCRKRDRIEARADCIIAVKQAYPKSSLPRLGQIFGNRDHTTILHYLRKRDK